MPLSPPSRVLPTGGVTVSVSTFWVLLSQYHPCRSATLSCSKAVRCASSIFFLAFSASSGKTPNFSSIRASASRRALAGVSTSCSAPPSTLPKISRRWRIFQASLCWTPSGKEFFKPAPHLTDAIADCVKQRAELHKRLPERCQPFHNAAEHTSKNALMGSQYFQIKQACRDKCRADQTYRTQ